MNNRNNEQARQELLNYLGKYHYLDKMSWIATNNLVEETMEFLEEKINLLNY